MSYTRDLTDKEWSVVEPLLLEYLLGKKRTCPLKWSYREIFTERYLMPCCINSKMDVIGETYRRIFHLTQQFTGITNNGESAD